MSKNNDMNFTKIFPILFFCLGFSLLSFSQSYKVLTNAELKSDGAAGIETYELIRSVLGPDALEAPDLYPDNHPEVKHVIEESDTVLGNHFTFLIHRDIDKDRDTDYTDRQRNEIKAYSGSDDKLKAFKGESLRYNWFFQLDEGFSISKNFSHFFQLKAVGGDYDDQPITTISGSINSNNNEFEIIHSSLTGAEDVQLTHTDWSLANTGKWMEMEVFATFDDEGYLKITISDLDGNVIMQTEQESIDMWREGSDFVRPKWGIYRSLSSKLYLNVNEERAHFADFSIQKIDLNYVAGPPEPATLVFPDNNAQYVDSALSLSWTQGYDTQFNRIYLSTDSLNIGNYPIDSTILSSTLISGLLPDTKYFWRVDGTNEFGTTTGEVWNFTTAHTTVELIIQENEKGFAGVDGTIENTFAGYTGEGYANSNDASGSKINWIISSAPREYNFKWRYANGTRNNLSAFLKINGQAVGIINFPPTESWENWAMDSAQIVLAGNESTILLQALTSDGLANIDYLYAKGGNLEAIATGINEDYKTDNPITVYPNPFNEALILILKQELSSQSSWKIYNNMGQVTKQGDVSDWSKQITIDTQSLPKGIYYLNVLIGENIYLKKLVK